MFVVVVSCLLIAHSVNHSRDDNVFAALVVINDVLTGGEPAEANFDAVAAGAGFRGLREKGKAAGERFNSGVGDVDTLRLLSKLGLIN